MSPAFLTIFTVLALGCPALPCSYKGLENKIKLFNMKEQSLGDSLSSIPATEDISFLTEENKRNIEKRSNFTLQRAIMCWPDTKSGQHWNHSFQCVNSKLPFKWYALPALHRHVKSYNQEHFTTITHSCLNWHLLWSVAAHCTNKMLRSQRCCRKMAGDQPLLHLFPVISECFLKLAIKIALLLAQMNETCTLSSWPL